MWTAVLIVVLAAHAAAAHPECRYACDDPVCAAVCRPVCAPAACQVQCPAPWTCTAAARCRNVCAAQQDASELESCPMCETLCDALPAHCTAHECAPLCEAPQCSWLCEKPAHCPQPRCELQCEQPACASNGLYKSVNGGVVQSVALGFLLLLLALCAVF